MSSTIDTGIMYYSTHLLLPPELPLTISPPPVTPPTTGLRGEAAERVLHAEGPACNRQRRGRAAVYLEQQEPFQARGERDVIESDGNRASRVFRVCCHEHVEYQHDASRGNSWIACGRARCCSGAVLYVRTSIEMLLKSWHYRVYRNIGFIGIPISMEMSRNIGFMEFSGIWKHRVSVCFEMKNIATSYIYPPLT